MAIQAIVKHNSLRTVTLGSHLLFGLRTLETDPVQTGPFMPSSSHVLSVDTTAVEIADERSRNSIYLCFCAWLISLSAMPSQFVRAVECDRLNNIPSL